jgi:hypothetical protein
MTLPINAIIMWDKPIAEIMQGWAICDGSGGTPDMRGLFVYGASSDAHFNAVGGKSAHDHTNSDVGAGGNHRHTVSVSLGGTVGLSRSGNWTGAVDDGVHQNHSHGFSANSAYDTDHTHPVGNTSEDAVLPPYCTLYYIMRVE